MFALHACVPTSLCRSLLLRADGSISPNLAAVRSTGKVVGVLLIIKLSCLHSAAQKPEDKHVLFLVEHNGFNSCGMLSRLVIQGFLEIKDSSSVVK